jgi:hypothetical protein
MSAGSSSSEEGSDAEWNQRIKKKKKTKKLYRKKGKTELRFVEAKYVFLYRVLT